MFWGGKKKEDDRTKQVNQLKHAFPSIRRPHNDDSTFEFRFTVEGHYSTLRLCIPEDFPQGVPTFQVVGPCEHPWLSPMKFVIGSKKLNAWNKDSSLVVVVEEVLQNLVNAGSLNKSTATAQVASTSNASGGLSVVQATAYPTAVTTSTTTTAAQYAAPPPTYGAYSGIQPSANTGYNNNNSNIQSYYGGYPAAARPASSNTQPQQQQQVINNNAAPPTITVPQPVVNNSNAGKAQQQSSSEVAHSPMRMALPDVPVSFPELERLTDTQLQRLLNDTIALEVHVQAAESVSSMEAVRDSQREMNAQTAANNVVLGEEVNKLRQTAAELQQKLLALATENTNIQVDIIRSEENKRKAAINRLRQKASDLDTSSDELGTRFVAGEIDIDKFMAEYIDGRMKYHALDTKVGIATSRLNLYS